jgi:hypothetical protein
MKQLRRFNAALDRGLSKSVFDHVRNYMMCSLLLAIAVRGFDQDVDLLFDLIPNTYSGISLVILSCVLFCLNLYDGIREISKTGHHPVFIFGLVLLYMVMTVVVIELASSFRASL